MTTNSCRDGVHEIHARMGSKRAKHGDREQEMNNVYAAIREQENVPDREHEKKSNR